MSSFQEAQEGPAILRKSGSSHCIGDGIFRFSVLGAIDLNGKSVFWTSKIDDVASYRILSSKTWPHQTMRSKFIP